MARPLYRKAGAILALLAITLLSNSCRSLPEGLSQATPLRALQEAELLVDSTGVDALGQRHVEQQIFDEALRLIDQAERLVVLDMFLFNAFQGKVAETHRALSAELTAHLLQRKQQRPALRIVVISDPFNTLYGGVPAPHLEALRAAGVEVVLTDLTRLPDSNPSWSALWRVCCQWLGNRDDSGWLPNPVGPGKVTLRSYLALLNFKANHRKVLVVDEGDNWTGLVSSANPHDGSSAHSNLGLRLSGDAALDLLQSEAAVLRFSSPQAPMSDDWPQAASSTPVVSGPRVQVLTEGRIRDALLAALDSAGPGDRIDIEVFYFSHQPLLYAMLDAAGRGVALRVLLDPNKDAFGREKNGIPNRQVAFSLHQAGIPVRWCNTSGEQCHTKSLLLLRQQADAELILGSANYTRRNLDDLNLETDLRVIASPDHPVISDARQLFERRWQNHGGITYSNDYAQYADDSRWRRILYRFMEFSGWSSF